MRATEPSLMLADYVHLLHSSVFDCYGSVSNTNNRSEAACANDTSKQSTLDTLPNEDAQYALHL